MLPAVEFHSQENLRAVEIQEVFPHRMLPPELKAEATVSQKEPEQVFSIRLVQSQRPGKLSHPLWKSGIHPFGASLTPTLSRRARESRVR